MRFAGQADVDAVAGRFDSTLARNRVTTIPESRISAYKRRTGSRDPGGVGSVWPPCWPPRRRFSTPGREAGASLDDRQLACRIVQGGAHYQQFVRGALLDRSKGLRPKVREAWPRHASSRSTEGAICSVLNTSTRRRLYGVQAAALGYFAKPASALDAAESATLAALINRPSGYGIRKTPTNVRDRRDWVLRQMHHHGHLDAATYGNAIATPVASTLAQAKARADVDPIG